MGEVVFEGSVTVTVGTGVDGMALQVQWQVGQPVPMKLSVWRC